MIYRVASSALIVLAGFGKAPVPAAAGPKVVGEDHVLLGTIEQNRASRPADLGDPISTLSRGAA